MSIEDELREHLRAVIAPIGTKTTSEVGKESEVDYTQIYRFINGQTQLRSGTVAKLCTYLGLRLCKEGEQAGSGGDYEARLKEGIREGIERALHGGLEQFLRERVFR